MTKINNRGQAAIIVLLLTALALSFGLSTTKQTLVDTRIETDTQDQRRAFNAAESAIDNYIGSNGTEVIYGSSVGSSAVVVKNDISGVSKNGALVLEYPDFVSFGQRSYFWLMGHNPDGTLTTGGSLSYYSQPTIGVCFDSNFYGGLVVEVIYRNDSTPTPAYTIERNAYNVRLSGSNIGGNNFTTQLTGACGVGELATKYGFDFTLTTNAPSLKYPVLMMIRPLTADTESATMRGSKLLLRANGIGTFPVQGYELAATGNSGSTQRILRVENRWVPALGYDFWLDTVTAADSIEGN